MPAAVASTSPTKSAKARFAAKVAPASAGGRPLDASEYDLARFVIRRWQSARSIIAGLYGSADETDEYQAARERHAAFNGDELAYLRVAVKDRDLLTPDDLQSYARFAAYSVAQPGSIERATWAMLRASEIDIVRLIEALNAGVEGFTPTNGASLVIDGRRFSVRYLDGDFDPRDARLIVAPLAGANRGDGGDILAN